MIGRLFCFLLALQIVSLVSAVRKPFLPAQEEVLQSPPPYTTESKKVRLSLFCLELGGILGVLMNQCVIALCFLSMLKGFMDIDTSETMQEAYDRGVSKIGSSPPSCEHKCYGCVPCEAIQVPSTSTRRSHLGIQYANYEPESWKCKCGPSFYSP
ncbi:hypothetical protein LR48_Vigan1082s003300 [Vigna angularis]|uniref:Epidermal patterning factor-like protein n=2 Tax=Phaseolus angularis TaxID=3914 RepID=A0A0L9TIG1_PHAAN|nr:hypothetical protein LR48_Vigan1082s003300 [Vigna angularis]BAT98376.1 hypothetical protein VIGAN_09202600 [Vigna angularis var. angularis]